MISPRENCFIQCNLNGSKSNKAYPSAPLENNDLQQRLEMKRNDVNNFKNWNINIKEKITYFKDKNHKSKE